MKRCPGDVTHPEWSVVGHVADRSVESRRQSTSGSSTACGPIAPDRQWAAINGGAGEANDPAPGVAGGVEPSPRGSALTSVCSQAVKSAAMSSGSAPRGNGRGAPSPKANMSSSASVVASCVTSRATLPRWGSSRRGSSHGRRTARNPWDVRVGEVRDAAQGEPQ